MKYIRTKDGIYEIIYEEETFYKCKGNIFVSKDIFYHKNRVANTIEELCDYCFYYNCYGELVIRKLPLSTSLKSLYEDMKCEMVKDIKLAILTDKGLIYVAKMNDKGELELL